MALKENTEAFLERRKEELEKLAQAENEKKKDGALTIEVSPEKTTPYITSSSALKTIGEAYASTDDDDNDHPSTSSTNVIKDIPAHHDDDSMLNAIDNDDNLMVGAGASFVKRTGAVLDGADTDDGDDDHKDDADDDDDDDDYLHRSCELFFY